MAQCSHVNLCSSFKVLSHCFTKGLVFLFQSLTNSKLFQANISAWQVTVERNELKDETSALEAEVTRLHNELRERQSDPMEHNNIADPALSSQPSSTALPAAQPPIAPFFVFPFGHDLNTLPDAATFPSLPKPTSQVRKPHARYPTPSDSWPLQILSSHQLCDSGSCNSGNDSSERAWEFSAAKDLGLNVVHRAV